MTFNDLISIYKEYLWIDDPHLMPVVFGSVLSNRLDNVKDWIFIMAPSAHGKSEILMSLGDCQDTYTVDSITDHTFTSHFKSTEDKSLLPKLNKKTLVIKDLSPLSEIHPNVRSSIFSQLRAIYDGVYKGASGMGEKGYKSSFGILAGCTPYFEKYRSAESSLGERFLYFRLRIKDMEAASKMTEKHIGHQSEMQEALKAAAKEFLDNLIIETRGKKPRTAWDKIEEFCKFLVTLRCSTMRDFSKDIDYPMVTSEAPLRLSKILIGLYNGLRALGLSISGAVDCCRRVIFDSCPMVRTIILESILEGKSSAREIAEDVKMSVGPIYRYLEELKYIGIIEGEGTLRLVDKYEKIFKELSKGLSFRGFLVK